MIRNHTYCLLVLVAVATARGAPAATNETVVTVQPEARQQVFQGMGCGLIYFEGHVTSLAARGKLAEQEQLFDAMFRDVPTDYLQLMIRHNHEPANDNADPYTPEFREENFACYKATLAVCEAARKRRPNLKLYATLYTPPAWMKTNNEPGGGGKLKATLKPGLEAELGEFCWAFLDYMHRHGQTVDFLSIANEPDWPHTQPGYFLTPRQHAELFGKVAAYLDEMHRRRPAVPRPRLVAPNVLSAVDCAKRYLPPLLEGGGQKLDVVGGHDYDRRGHRWQAVTQMSQGRPVWVTEWCVNGPDTSPGLLRSAAEFWLAMTEAFNDGVNVWMAYDWAYPTRQGGEALIHIDWGQRYHLTKIYHGFKQWCAPLAPGMRVVRTEVSGACASDISKPGVKAAAFMLPDGRRLVVQVANVQEQEAAIRLNIGGAFAAAKIIRHRTSATEDAALLPEARMQRGAFGDNLPPRGMVTYQLTPVGI